MAGGTGGTAVSPSPWTSAPGTSMTRWLIEAQSRAEAML